MGISIFFSLVIVIIIIYYIGWWSSCVLFCGTKNGIFVFVVTVICALSWALNLGFDEVSVLLFIVWNIVWNKNYENNTDVDISQFWPNDSILYFLKHVRLNTFQIRSILHHSIKHETRHDVWREIVGRKKKKIHLAAKMSQKETSINGLANYQRLHN